LLRTPNDIFTKYHYAETSSPDLARKLWIIFSTTKSLVEPGSHLRI